MKDIHEFLTPFFQAELNARNAYIRPDISFANKELATFHSYSISDLEDTFGMITDREPNPDFYETMEGVSYEQPRHLFKITHYKNKKYGDLYFAFVSNFNPKRRNLRIVECFVVGEAGDKFKIIKTFIFGEGEGKIPFWNKGYGDKDVSMENPGELLEVKRYQEPTGDPYSMEEYQKDL